MKKVSLLISAIAMVVLSSCSQKATNVPFTQVQKYFVKNTYAGTELAASPVISSQDQFDAIFGAGTTMGAGGAPTPLDFEKQFVIAVVENETNLSTELEVEHLTQTKAGELELKIEKEVGEKQSFTTRPILLLAVDKKYQAKVTVKE